MSFFFHRKRFLALVYFIKYQRSKKTDLKAKKWLLSFFKEEKGLLLKIGQIWGTSQDLKELLFEVDFSQKSFPKNSLIKALSQDLGQPFEQVFDGLEILSDKASLSTVYLTTLKSEGKKVVIKKKRENVDRLIKEQFSFFRLLSLLQKWSPFQKHDFDFKAYLDECQSMIEKELNYFEEAQSQIHFSQLNKHRPQVLVPEVYQDFVFKDWFVQGYINADDYLELLEKWPANHKEPLLYLFCQTFLEQLFVDGYVQGDSHLGNYLFVRDETNFERVVFLDFGAHLKLSDHERKALLCLFDLVHQTQLSSQKIQHLLTVLGFDEKKLAQLGPLLVSVIQQMLYVLSNDRACLLDPKDMPSIEELLQEQKWVLRSSGPPRFLQIMRAFYGLSALLKKAQVPLNYYQIYARFRSQNPDLLLNIHLAPIKVETMNTSSQAKNLKIIVKKNGVTSVDLSMPITSLYDLEDLLPTNAAQTLKEMGMNIEEIKNKAIRSGLIAQTLFEWSSGEKSYQVSLV